MPQFIRLTNSPALAKGSTYGGWIADAIADPSVCYAPSLSLYVMVVSLWDNTRGKWASAFFKSSDLASWTYVTGSLRAPTGSDYIYGNGGIVYFNGRIYHAYAHYASGFAAQRIALEYYNPSDLTTPNAVADPLLSLGGDDASYQYDPSLSVNPTTGKMEVWYAGGNGSTQTICYADSPDGVTWTKRGAIYSRTAISTVALGEPHVWYFGGVRYMTYDAGNEVNVRLIGLASSATQDANWIDYGSALGSSGINAWENVQVFDSCVLPVDRGDGRGVQFWLVYAGGDNGSGADNTNSSIGLAYMDPAKVTSFNVRASLVGVAFPAMLLDATQPLYAPAKAGDKMDIVNVPNAAAVTVIQTGLSKPGTAQTITPADTSAAATAQAAIAARLDATVSSRSTFATGGSVVVSDKTGFALSSAAITAIESAFINETDGQAVLAAIVSKINATDVDLSGLSTASIAAAVWQYLLASATTTGSTGKFLADIQSGVVFVRAKDHNGAALAEASSFPANFESLNIVSGQTIYGGSAPTVQQISDRIERDGGMLAATLTAATNDSPPNQSITDNAEEVL